MSRSETLPIGVQYHVKLGSPPPHTHTQFLIYLLISSIGDQIILPNHNHILHISTAPIALKGNGAVYKELYLGNVTIKDISHVSTVKEYIYMYI